MTRKNVLYGFLALALVALAINFRIDLMVKKIYVPRIIASGDSIMAAGTILTRTTIKLEAATQSRWNAENLAVSGLRVAHIDSLPAIDGPAVFRLPWKKGDIVWLLAGTNDLGHQGGPDAVETLLADVTNFFRRQHEAGYSKDNCFYTDLLPRTFPASFDSDRKAFNSKIAERLSDLAHVIPSGENPALQDPFDKALYSDGVHPTPAADELIATDAAETIAKFAR